ncbi:hypothetical protein SSTU70S_00166 [Stutzerimonas stutzeri]
MSYPPPPPRPKAACPASAGIQHFALPSPGEAVTFFRGSSPQRVTTAKQAI